MKDVQDSLDSEWTGVTDSTPAFSILQLLQRIQSIPILAEYTMEKMTDSLNELNMVEFALS